MKKELLSLLTELLKDSEASYIKVFKLLDELRETDVSTMLTEASKLDDKS